jgi:hypothetical protein
VKDGGNEPIKHGGCLGLGLAAMGTRRADVYEQLKFTLFQVKIYFFIVGFLMRGSPFD